jgi:hypothetical protein
VSLSTADLDLIAASREVSIETRTDKRVHRTVIWVVVDNERIYVRSVRGPSGRWFQRALADPGVVLIVGDTRFPLQAIPADDAESVERASQGFRRKYPKGRSLDAMLHAEVLGTTLRLQPDDPDPREG